MFCARFEYYKIGKKKHYEREERRIIFVTQILHISHVNVEPLKKKKI